MTTPEFLLCLLSASGERVRGRTLLQKRAFFVLELIDEDIDLGFDAHYYGPYSPVIESALSRLKSLGFIDENNVGFGFERDGFEMKRYDYRVTEDGRSILEQIRQREAKLYHDIVGAYNKIREAGDPTYFELSIAAKAYFIVRRANKPMSSSDVIREAERFDWNIQPESMKKAIAFLEKLHLVSNNPQRANA